MSINKLFKGKSKEEIVKSLCKEINVPYNVEESDFILKMYKIIPIIHTDENIFIYYYTKIVKEIEKTSIKDFSETIIIDEKIVNWQKNYLNLITLIQDNCNFIDEVDLFIKKDIVSNINVIINIDDLLKSIMYSNSIFTKNYNRHRHLLQQPTTFILANSELSDYIPEKFINFDIIFDENIEGIILGRKQAKMEYGIFLIKSKEYFKLYKPNDINELFCKINYKLIDDNK